MQTVAEQHTAPFADPTDAIRWADNYLLQPDCKTITGKLMEDNIQQPRGVKSQINQKDLAICITTTLAGCTSPYNHAVRLVYGRGESHRMELADQLAHATWTGPEGGKTIAAARDLALMVTEQIKKAERYNKRLATAKIASEMKLSRGHFYEKWGETYSHMRKHFNEMVTRGINEAGQRLVDAGVVG